MPSSRKEYLREMEMKVKDYLKNNRVAINYVRNSFGYPIGIVLAIGRDKIGYSQVNTSDYTIKNDLKLHQLPAIQRLENKIRYGLTTESIFQSRAYKMYNEVLSEDGYFTIPKFNRNIGLNIALTMAIDGGFDVREWLEFNPGRQPLNFFMREAITNMIARSRKIKAFNPAVND